MDRARLLCLCVLAIQLSKMSLTRHLQHAIDFAKLFICFILFYHGTQ